MIIVLKPDVTQAQIKSFSDELKAMFPSMSGEERKKPFSA